MRDRVQADERLAILVQLDVLDVLLEGGYAINASFQSMCRVAYAADPTRYETIVPDLIRQRAEARGVVLDVDADELSLAAFDAAAPDA